MSQENSAGGQPLVGAPNSNEKPMPHCPESAVDVSETAAMVIFVFNIISPGFGTLISSCLDRKGCNCTAFLVSYLQGFAVILCLYGWYWSIMHGIAIKENSQGKQWEPIERKLIFFFYIDNFLNKKFTK